MQRVALEEEMSVIRLEIDGLSADAAAYARKSSKNLLQAAAVGLQKLGSNSFERGQSKHGGSGENLLQRLGSSGSSLELKRASSLEREVSLQRLGSSGRLNTAPPPPPNPQRTVSDIPMPPGGLPPPPPPPPVFAPPKPAAMTATMAAAMRRPPSDDDSSDGDWDEDDSPKPSAARLAAMRRDSSTLVSDTI